MKPTVFISSTCYDLIDLRAELKKEFEDMGLIPLLSDSLSSEFKVVPDKNSIESCLVNVRESQYFVLILSQRYGPSLKGAGYEDISATHLEYEEALKNKLPVFVYVRDKLEGELAIYERSPDNLAALRWINPKDSKIFEILKKHKPLSKTENTNNWYWTFKDSVELKSRIRLDFNKASGQSVINRLITSGQSPCLVMDVLDHSNMNGITTIHIRIRNVGKTSAIKPFLAWYNLPFEEFAKTDEKELVIENGKVIQLPSFMEGDSYDQKIELKIASLTTAKAGSSFSLPFDILYTATTGHVVSDVSTIVLDIHPSGNQISRKPQSYYEFKRFMVENGIKTRISSQIK